MYRPLTVRPTHCIYNNVTAFQELSSFFRKRKSKLKFFFAFSVFFLSDSPFRKYKSSENLIQESSGTGTDAAYSGNIGFL